MAPGPPLEWSKGHPEKEMPEEVLKHKCQTARVSQWAEQMARKKDKHHKGPEWRQNTAFL